MATTPDRQLPEPDVFFSAERTYLAWIRTGLALMGFGFVLARFSLLAHQLQSMGSSPVPADAQDLSRYFGTALVMVGVLTTAAATISHVRTVRRLNTGEPFKGRPTWVGVLVAVLLVAVGTLMSVYLLRTPTGRARHPQQQGGGARSGQVLEPVTYGACGGSSVTS